MSYYMGDYYRGDPFSIGGLLGGIAKTIGGVAGGLISGGPIGAIAGGVTAAATVLKGSSSITPPFISPPAPVFPGGASLMSAGGGPGRPIASFGGNLGPISGGMQIGGGQPGTSVQAPGIAAKGYHVNKAALKGKPYKRLIVKNQHMNVANSRALRRAIRRGRGFVKLARRAAHAFGFKVVSKGQGTRHAARRRR